MKKTHIIGIVVIAVAIGAILATVSDSSTYASFNQAVANPGSEYHVVGRLNKSKEMVYDPQVSTNLFTFYMTDNEGTETKVHFKGSKPQDFEKSEQVVLIGNYNGQVFVAEKILMKCPSKYNDGQQGEMQEFKAQG
jgi:cytochrome c-type biogenesis protein CcmE